MIFEWPSIRVTGSMMIFLRALSMNSASGSKTAVVAQMRLASLEQLGNNIKYRVRRRRAPRNINIHRNKLVHGTRLRKELWNNFRRRPKIQGRVLYISPCHDGLHTEWISHGGNIGRHRAIAQRNQRLRFLTNRADFVEILLRADRTLDESDIHALGKYLC